MRVLALLITILSVPMAHAAIEAYEFQNPQQEKAFKELTFELRCLVCQNQNIADSNADLAKDLRSEIHKMLVEGKDKQQVVDFMVQRYGDFVLYRPPVNTATMLLWFGPFVIGIIGLVLLIRFIRGRAATPAVATELSAEERVRLKSLLGDEESKQS
ncbi:MAG: cytochrome c-type biogenesis protein CcmH [Gammaproteobacteria bacterium]